MYVYILSISFYRPFQMITETGFDKDRGFRTVTVYKKDTVNDIFQKIFLVLGRFYELNRLDRDDYVQIYWDNINPSENLHASANTCIPRKHEIIHTLHVYNTCMYVYVCMYVFRYICIYAGICTEVHTVRIAVWK